MRKFTLSALLLLSGGIVMAQTAIPNGNFEEWEQDSFEYPKYYVATSNHEIAGSGIPYNCEKSTDAYHGSHAIKLTTASSNGNIIPGYFVNSQPEGDPQEWHGGIPYAQTPSGLRAYYKSDVKTGDTAFIIAVFSKAGLNIGSYIIPITGQHTTYTLIDHTFNPPLLLAPDSVIFGAVSSNVLREEGISGSMLQLDSISFTGVSSQPVNFNGDFEEWDIKSIATPEYWYRMGGWDFSDMKTNDAYKGDFAIRLETVLDYRNDGAIAYARPGHLSTGYYEEDCQNCQLQGGYPYTETTDTLAFWYKYTAAGGSKAEVQVTLKKNGAVIWGQNLELNAAATYTYAELPIYLMQTPDTLVVEIRSVRWMDSLPANVGAILHIDEIQLKSDPLHTSLSPLLRGPSMLVYPNPAKDFVAVRIEDVSNYPGAQIKLVNMVGQTLYQSDLSGPLHQIEVSSMPKGQYIVLMEFNGQYLIRQKLVID